MIITIGGLAGSGTTTASKILSEKLDIPYISAGDIFRQMAAESSMDILDFSEFAENNIEIDIEIDRRQAEIAREAKTLNENLIVEGRLSAHFVDADLKIWMIAPFDIRSRRISQRESKTVEIANKEIQIRENSEACRYMEIHQIDINNLEIYDLIVNTNSFQAESIVDIILKVTEVI
jgi:cytidylate kinase